MNVVADTGAIGGGVIGAEDLDVRPLSEDGLEDERDEVSFRIVVLADLVVRVSARGIEVAQRNPFQSMRRAVLLAFRFWVLRCHCLRYCIGDHRVNFFTSKSWGLPASTRRQHQ